MSARIRHAILSSMQEKLSEGGAINMLTGDAIRLFKDSEDRAHGTPKAVTEIGGIGGGAMQLAITRTIVDPKG